MLTLNPLTGDDGFDTSPCRGRSGSVERPGRSGNDSRSRKDSVHAIYFLEGMAAIRKNLSAIQGANQVCAVGVREVWCASVQW